MSLFSNFPPVMPSVSSNFPESFILGIADADLQVIGEDATRAEEGSEQTMWDHFARTSGKCWEGATPGSGIDRYHRFVEDIKIMQAMGVKHYRTSISMSRLLTRDGKVNEKALDWYKQYYQLLRDADIRIYATLYHWELPQYLQEQGGWKNRKIVDHFLMHARAVAEHLDEYIEEYFLVNEPWCIAIKGYFHGGHAPGETDLSGALQASHHVMLAIGQGYREIHSLRPNAKIGTVFNTESYYAASQEAQDVRARNYADGHFNRWFIDPIFTGAYPQDMLELYGKHAPSIEPGDMDIIKVGNQLHTFGLNYYSGAIVKASTSSPLGYEAVNPDAKLTNDLNWPIILPPVYSEGLYDVLQQIYHDYKHLGLKHVWIMENGMAQRTLWDKKSETVEDARRIFYIRQHLLQILKARAAGIPVEGYLAWTLMDNYEWEEGYRPESCFGMIHVDRTTMQRVWKRSARWYSEVMKTRVIGA